MKGKYGKEFQGEWDCDSKQSGQGKPPGHGDSDIKGLPMRAPEKGASPAEGQQGNGPKAGMCLAHLGHNEKANVTEQMRKLEAGSPGALYGDMNHQEMGREVWDPWEDLVQRSDRI